MGFFYSITLFLSLFVNVFSGFFLPKLFGLAFPFRIISCFRSIFVLFLFTDKFNLVGRGRGAYWSSYGSCIANLSAFGLSLLLSFIFRVFVYYVYMYTKNVY